jgi:hypothetical protein
MARLLKRLERVEAAEAAEAVAGNAIGICWSSFEGNRVDASTLARGELIAADVTIDYWDHMGVPNILVVERVTRDEADVGWVFDRQGEKIGRVVEIQGTLMMWRMFQEAVQSAGSGARMALQGDGDGGGTFRVVEY